MMLVIIRKNKIKNSTLVTKMFVLLIILLMLKCVHKSNNEAKILKIKNKIIK
jgi:hypothetical protein